MIQCPKCQKNIVDTAEDGTKRLRSKLVLFTDEGAVALCPSCKEQVPVPVTLGSFENTKQPLVHYVKRR